MDIENAYFYNERSQSTPGAKAQKGKCKIGQRSMMAGQLALNDQYDEVHNMTGGMIRWAESGLPIQQ